MNNNITIYFGGAFSGMCGVLLSHPFDTIKTHFQENKQFNMNPNISTFKKLYKGLLPPLIGVGFEKSIVFGTHHLIYNKLNGIIDCDIRKHLIAGGCSGLVASTVVTPFERIKILLQTDNSKLLNNNIKFYFKGLSATFSRETPGFAIYFATYESLKKYYSIKDITPQTSFLFGGISGTISWIFIYPQDKIKTKMQASIVNTSFFDTVKNMYKLNGICEFYKGFHYALMRAVPLHAGTFMTMEMLKKHIKD